MKRKAGKQEWHPRGPLTITISGRSKAGKSYLAAYLGFTFASNGHHVCIGRGEKIPTELSDIGKIINKIAHEKQPIFIDTKTTKHA